MSFILRKKVNNLLTPVTSYSIPIACQMVPSGDEQVITSLCLFVGSIFYRDIVWVLQVLLNEPTEPLVRQ